MLQHCKIIDINNYNSNNKGFIIIMSQTPATLFSTIRDFLRYAVSQFSKAELTFGHGTNNAYDEAAYLVLEGLNLPIDQLEPFLDARLLPHECARLIELIELRISSRKPLPYLFNKAYMQGVPFYVDERVIVPRSYIGELMNTPAFINDPHAVIPDIRDVETVLDLCTGSGCLAILASFLFENAHVDATDLSPDALEVARMNVEKHKLSKKITLHQGNLFEPVKGKKFDLIIANPPYVAFEEVENFDPEYKAEPVMAHLSGKDGLDCVRKILTDAKEYLSDIGVLVCEFGIGREILEAEYPHLPFVFLDTEQSEGEVFALSALDLTSLH
jgi:ribosomal protein L3 glutamine methyltransferase